MRKKLKIRVKTKNKTKTYESQFLFSSEEKLDKEKSDIFIGKYFANALPANTTAGSINGSW